MWFAVPTVAEVNGNCGGSSLVDVVICYFGPNVRACNNTHGSQFGSKHSGAEFLSFGVRDLNSVSEGVTQDFYTCHAFFMKVLLYSPEHLKITT